MADSVGDYLALMDTEDFRNKSFEEQIEIKEQIANAALYTPEVQALNIDERSKFMNMVRTTRRGMFSPEVQNNERAMTYINAAESALNNQKVDLNVIDGFSEGVKDFIVGRVGTALVDVFNPNDVSQEIYGDESEKARRYFDYVAEQTDVQGANDYKVAKVLGKVAGFAGDAYASGQLYGAVGAPGFIGKLLGMPGRATAMGAKGLEKLGLYAAQLGIESVGYMGEDILARSVAGQLDSSEEWQEYMGNIPGTLGKGFAYAMAGEVLGSAIDFGKAAGRSVFKQGSTFAKPKAFDKMGNDELMGHIVRTFEEDAVLPQTRDALLAAGYDEEFIKTMERGANRANLVKKADPWINNPMEAMEKTMFAQFGADVESLPDGFKVTGVGGQPIDSPILVTNQTEFVEAINKIRNTITGRNYDRAVELGAINEGNVGFRVETIGTGKSFEVDQSVGRNMFQPKDGNVSKTAYEDMLQQSDLTKNIEVVPVDNYFKQGFATENGKLFVPTTINNSSEGLSALKQVSSQLSKQTGGQVKLNVDQMIDRLQKGKNLSYDKSYIDEMLPTARIEYTDKGVTVQMQEGEPIRFDSIDDLGATLHASEFSDTELASIMKDRGYTISKDIEGTITVKDDNTGFVYDRFATVEDMLKDPQYRPGRPFHKRWRVTMFDQGAGDVLGESQIKSGPLDGVLNRLKGFESYNSMAPRKNIVGKGSVTYTDFRNKFVAQLGDSGIEKEFDTIKEAEEWVRNGAQTYRDLVNDALDDGYYVWESKGSYNIYTDGMENPITTNSLENVRRHLKRQNELKKTPDVLQDVDTDTQRALGEQYDNISTEVKKELDKLGVRAEKAQKYSGSLALTKFKDLFMPTIDRVKRTGDLRAGQLAEQGASVNALFNADYERFVKPMNALKGRFSPTQRSDMGKIFRAETDQLNWQLTAEKMGIELTPEMESAMRTMRQMLDSAGRNFSVEPDTWIQNYSPRLMNITPQQLYDASDGEKRNQLLAKAFATSVDKLQAPFFKHLRAEDVNQGIFQDDLFQIVDTYVRVGKKEQYFKPFSDAVQDYKAANKGASAGSVELSNRVDLTEMEDKMMGRVWSSEKARDMAIKQTDLQDKAKKIMDGLGPWKDKDFDERYKAASTVVADAFNVSDLVTSSLMAFKFKMPARNISQPYITLAPVVGTRYLKDANHLMGDKNAFIMKYAELYNKGIIPPRQTIDSDLRGPVAWLKKATDKGMDWFYGSDDYTRMVASISVSERFKDGLTKLRAGDWDFEEFGKFMKLDYLDPQDKINVSKLLQDGQVEAAETSLQRIFTRMSMFEYSGLNKPRAHNSGMGKIWGQFGTYPLQFAQLVRRGWEADGPAYLGKLVAANAAVGIIYHDLLGMDNMPLNPVSSVMFLGGPVVSNMGQLAGVPQGGLSLGDAKTVMRVGTGYVPFYGATSNFVKSIQHLNEGSYVDALYKVGGLAATDNRYFETPEAFIEDFI